MSDIFLSYAHEDQARIQQLAHALEAQGWTVFWDRTLSAGSTWRDTIGEALETAGCVVVAWSKHSIASHWVCEEAEEGQGRNLLVPVFLDNVKPPLGFRSIHAANLALWDGSTDAEAFRHLVSSIGRVIGTPKIQAQPTPPVQKALADRQAELKKAMAQAESDRRLAEEHAAAAKAQRLAAEQVNEQNRENTKPSATLQKPSKKLRPYAWLILAVALVLAGGWLFNANKPSERIAPIERQEEVNAKEVAEAKRQADDQARDADAKRAEAEAESKRLAEENAKAAEAKRLAAEQANAEQEAQRRAAETTKPLTVFQDTLKDGSLGPKMVWMPTGQFRMGDLTGKGYKGELPVHTVKITQSFAMGQYEVTFDDYDKFAKATQRELPDDISWGRGKRPVINVSWNDAVAYAQSLSTQTGKPYRLPTEAEWEFAARAETETDYWWGNELGKNRANCDGCGSQWDNQQTAPVGSFPANAWGLHDTAGNVWEWAQDCYHDNYNGSPADGTAWQQGDCANRVLRGGSWDDGGRSVRSAYRHGLGPDRRFNDLGFRLALGQTGSRQAPGAAWA
ncbi:MAG: SUMF1/EgtB/PvdO family nonheme iron enzyme [Proteobacteria bacterium]|nr:SUMF1/EgtB/PvdO family nonheme iron enzyme [Pseudomonadota bacterium]